jgi:hypothetical protein
MNVTVLVCTPQGTCGQTGCATWVHVGKMPSRSHEKWSCRAWSGRLENQRSVQRTARRDHTMPYPTIFFPCGLFSQSGHPSFSQFYWIATHHPL